MESVVASAGTLSSPDEVTAQPTILELELPLPLRKTPSPLPIYPPRPLNAPVMPPPVDVIVVTFGFAGEALADLSGTSVPETGLEVVPFIVLMFGDMPTTNDGIGITGASEKVSGIVDGDGQEGMRSM